MIVAFLLLTIADEPLDPTAQALRTLLGEVWNTPADRLKRTGSSAVTRAIRAKANPREAQYAYGWALAGAGAWDTAETTFRKLTLDDSHDASAWLSLAVAQAHSQKFDAALTSLTRAATADPKTPLLPETAGAMVAFLREKPPERLKRDAVRATEDVLLGHFEEQEATKYRATLDATTATLKDLPAARKKLLEDIGALTKQADAIKADLRSKEQQILAERARYDDLKTKNALMLRQLVAETALSQQLLQNPGAPIVAGQPSSGFAVELRELLADSEDRLRRYDREREKLATSLHAMETRVKEEERRVDDKLTRPALPLTPAVAREQLLAAHGLSIAKAPPTSEPTTATPTAKGTPPRQRGATPAPDSQEERKSRNLFAFADALRQSGQTDKALDYYRRIIKLYPHSRAADDAQSILSSLSKDDAAASEAGPTATETAASKEPTSP